MSERTYWRGHKLNFIADEPLIVSLLKYRRRKDRERCAKENANLVSSRTERGWQKPILDLDFPHEYVSSSNMPEGKNQRAHLYLNVEIPTWRWVCLMIGLRIGGVVEFGYVAWSLRRGANYVRPPGVAKTKEEILRAEKVPEYNLIRRNRRSDS